MNWNTNIFLAALCRDVWKVWSKSHDSCWDTLISKGRLTHTHTYHTSYWSEVSTHLLSSIKIHVKDWGMTPSWQPLRRCKASLTSSGVHCIFFFFFGWTLRKKSQTWICVKPSGNTSQTNRAVTDCTTWLAVVSAWTGRIDRQRLCNETCHYKICKIYHLFTHILLIMQSVYDLRQMLSFKTF